MSSRVVVEKRKFSVFDESMEINGFSRDLPQRCEGDVEEEEQIELTLGLSLNGRFGIDPKRAKLSRSSSIPEFLKSPESPPPTLSRTCSLPTEAGEEWRKRKEIQSLKRLEAKRRRLEKMKIGKISISFDGEEGRSRRSSLPINGVGIESKREKPTTHQWRTPSRQGSTGSSGVSESGSPPSPSPSPGIKNRSVYTNKEEEDKVKMMKSVLLEMPCVSTRGDGPNGKRINGFLYRYNKGEEVRIVCVCHGSFLSPAEFVRHSGAINVDHPLKHIVVNPSPVM